MRISMTEHPQMKIKIDNVIFWRHFLIQTRSKEKKLILVLSKADCINDLGSQVDKTDKVAN